MTDYTTLLMELAKCDGACLYWQLPNPQLAISAERDGVITMIDDLAIHPQAIEIERGNCYTMAR